MDTEIKHTKKQIYGISLTQQHHIRSHRQHHIRSHRQHHIRSHRQHHIRSHRQHHIRSHKLHQYCDQFALNCYELLKFLSPKFNGFELKHVHHREKLFLTQRQQCIQIKCNKCEKYKNVLPNHKMSIRDHMQLNSGLRLIYTEQT